jgi:nitrate reductase NapE
MSTVRPPEGAQPPPVAGSDRPEPAPPQHVPRATLVVDRQRRKEELRTWAFLTFVMAPVLAVAIVTGYGFLVWIFQLFSGPPTYGG